jgi:Ca2+-binding RTX toxin-like protein
MAKKIEGMPWDDGGWIMGFGEWWWRGTQTVGLVGTDEAEEIYGYGGNDSLHGNGGDDLLDGGTGRDFMNGGMGNDTYYVDDAGDVTVDDADVYDAEGNPANAGYDRVYASVSHTIGFGIEELRLVEGSSAANGTGNEFNNTIYGNSNDNELRGGGGRDWLYGNGDNDTLRGEAGDDLLYGGSHGDSLFGGTENDLLDGGTGGDKMRGEAGNDKYYVDNTLDEVIETANQGYDTVISSISHALWVNVEELRLLDSGGAINGTGNALGNDIYGNDSSNTLDSGGGNDDLVGNGGDDTYWIDSTGDRVFESAGEGADTCTCRAWPTTRSVPMSRTSSCGRASTEPATGWPTGLAATSSITSSTAASATTPSTAAKAATPRASRAGTPSRRDSSRASASILCRGRRSARCRCSTTF